MSPETRRQLIHLSVGAFAIPVPFLGPKWAVALAGFAVFTNWVIMPLTGRDKELMREGEKFLNGIRFYPVAVLVALLLLPLHLALASWAILAVGDAFSNIFGRAFGTVKLPWNRRKSWAGTLGFFVTAAPAALAFLAYTQHFAPNQSLLERHVTSGLAAPLAIPALVITGLVGAAVAALVESLPIDLDDNLTVTFSAGASMAATALALLA